MRAECRDAVVMRWGGGEKRWGPAYMTPAVRRHKVNGGAWVPESRVFFQLTWGVYIYPELFLERVNSHPTPPSNNKNISAMFSRAQMDLIVLTFIRSGSKNEQRIHNPIPRLRCLLITSEYR